jgi:3-hydroxyacyl-CoA dehydrogenase
MGFAMELDQALTNVAVLGAAGKMGSGIALLLLQEMALLELQKSGKLNSGAYRLNLIDVNASSFPRLRSYLHDQLVKQAEKNINQLRKLFEQDKALVSNEEVIEAYVENALGMIFFSTEVEAAKKAHLIFEAIIEDADIKADVFQKIAGGVNQGFFLTNTSSIPIEILNEKAKLNNRIIGFHFYNPPAIQKLLEIITTPTTNADLARIAEELAKRLKKTVVYSKDMAGFIGNGHMIREVSFACQKVKELSKDHSLPESIYTVNRVTQEWLIRPMGIFQLMDYVGLDVCVHISEIMSTYLKDPALKADLIEKMVKKGILGGQNPDGSQKDGFFSYAKHQIKSIYSLPESKYIPINPSWDQKTGSLPKGHQSWKTMQKNPQQETALKIYFENLQFQNSLGSQLAQAFLLHSRKIAHQLVQEGVSSSYKDVDTVLANGFYHLYGTGMLQEVKA